MKESLQTLKVFGAFPHYESFPLANSVLVYIHACDAAPPTGFSRVICNSDSVQP